MSKPTIQFVEVKLRVPALTSKYTHKGTETPRSDSAKMVTAKTMLSAPKAWVSGIGNQKTTEALADVNPVKITESVRRSPSVRNKMNTVPAQTAATEARTRPIEASQLISKTFRNVLVIGNNKIENSG